MKKTVLFFAAVAGLMFSAFDVRANVTLPAIFGDHMVLQQDVKIPVWGWANAGEKVSVKIGTTVYNSAGTGRGDKFFGSPKIETTAGPDGRWRVDLPAMHGMDKYAMAQELTVMGKNTITIQDVLVGEVWLASGQSNMELKMGNGLVQGKEAIDSSANPQLRFFVVQRCADLTPQTDVVGTWKIAAPDTLVSDGHEGTGITAVGYFFARELQQKLNRPVAIIESDWGGTGAESWTSLEALKTLPWTAGPGMDGTQKRKDAEPKDAAGRAAALADFHKQVDDWKKNVDDPFQAMVKKWYADCDAAKAAGQPKPPQPQEASNRPTSPFGENFEYSALYNGMISPLIPYAFRGALWYQGEANTGGDGASYGGLLKTMITDWRTHWNEGDFPFLVVGLANNDPHYPFPVDSGWAGVRWGQAQVTDTLQNTALAEAIDIGEAHNLHPLDKFNLSQRLAACALAKTYGQSVPYTGPRFTGMKVEGDKLRISYKDIGGGLVIGQPPAEYQAALAAKKLGTDDPLPPTDKLVGFAIAGADKKWVFADAKIDGNDVILSSPQVPAPVAARYGWQNNPQVNLYNKDGFPAVPFRTDDWGFVAPPPNPNH